MDKNFWLRKWQDNDTKWSQASVNPHLLTHQHLFGDLAQQTVFIPLCGDSIDMFWFLQQGANVVGVDLSQQAIDHFYATHQLDNIHPRLTLFCDDLFNLDREHLGNIDLVYDRAALIALTTEQRQRYVTTINAILQPTTKIFLISADYQAPTTDAPPFPVSDTEVNSLYSPQYAITRLEQVTNPPIPPHLQERGFTNVEENVYWLEKKS
jgi:thiopurine S-methyltransferase